MMDIYKSVIPFTIVESLGLVLVMIFPQIVVAAQFVLLVRLKKAGCAANRPQGC
jgi:type III secretory pathway component EscS